MSAFYRESPEGKQGVGSVGRTGEHCREDGGLAGCAGEEGESCGDQKGFQCW